MTRYALALYVLSIPFQRLWTLPVVGDTLQLPEVLFIPLLLCAVHRALRLRSWHWNLVDRAVVLWPLLHGVAAVLHGLTPAVLVDSVGAIYLATLYFALRVILIDEPASSVPTWLVASAVIQSLLGIAGWVTAVCCDITTPLALPSTTIYPYLGAVARAQVFSATPNMLASILMVGILLYAADRVMTRAPLGMRLPTLVVGFAVTFSKTVVCLLAGLAVIYWLARRSGAPERAAPPRLGLLTTLVLCVVVYVAGTHLLVATTVPSTVAALSDAGLVQSDPVWTVRVAGRTYGIYATNYLYNKRASVLAFVDTQGLGVGPGNYNQFVGTLQNQGRHPVTFPRRDPHSTYFGVAATLGILGLAVTLLLWGAVGTRLHRLYAVGAPYRPLIIGLAGTFTAVALEAVATDVMNFRHYWVLIALTGTLVGTSARARQAVE